MPRTSRLVTVLGLFLLVGLAFPPAADAQRRGGGGNGGGAVARGGGSARGGGAVRPGGPAGRGGAVYRGGHVAVPRTYRSYSHYRPAYSHYRPYSYRPYYYRPYYAGYYPYYSPLSFGLSFGIGWYGAYASYVYAYPYYPARYVAVTPPSYAVSTPSYAVSTPESSRADDPGEFGTLSLRVMPFDATIVIDRQAWDRPQGDERFSIELTAGPHQVEISKPGYTTYVRTIDVPRGQSLVLNVALTPAGNGAGQVARTVPFRQ